MERKKRGGPSSQSGKDVVSQNAVKHGATAKKLLSAEEQSRYQDLTESLARYYPSANPLVGIQIDRIARLTIQLDRIRDVIDVDFLESRNTSNASDSLMDLLKMDAQERSIAKGMALGQTQQDQRLTDEMVQVALELEQFSGTPPQDTDAFLERFPVFCTWLHEEAGRNKLDIPKLMDELAPRPSDGKPAPITVMFISTDSDKSKKAAAEQAPRTVQEAIKACDVAQLKSAREGFLARVDYLRKSNVKIQDYLRLMPIHGHAVTPDLDRLDRLMRYQTTLQRQLSTSIGELLALTGKGANAPGVLQEDKPG